MKYRWTKGLSNSVDSLANPSCVYNNARDRGVFSWNGWFWWLYDGISLHLQTQT